MYQQSMFKQKQEKYRFVSSKNMIFQTVFEQPYIVHSAVYILPMVLLDQQKYSEKSENIIGLDPFVLNSFSYLDPI